MSRYFIKDLQAVMRGLNRVIGISAEYQLAETGQRLQFLRSIPWAASRINCQGSIMNYQEIPARVGTVLLGMREQAKVCCGPKSSQSIRSFTVDHSTRWNPDKIRKHSAKVQVTDSVESSGSLEDEAAEAAKRAEKFMNQPIAPMDPEDKNDVVNTAEEVISDKVSQAAHRFGKFLNGEAFATVQKMDKMTEDLQKRRCSSSAKSSARNLPSGDASNHLTPESIPVKQTLGTKSRERKVPATRAARLASFGGLAAGLGVGALAEVTRRTFGIGRSGAAALLDKSAFLTDANAERIVDTLCRVRGAALKLGQMLSIQDTELLNPQVKQIFERVRQSADFMPRKQMAGIMERELGTDWRCKFAEFDDKPFAAASIGEVHWGKLKDGQEVAVKVQYPGVAEGIDSDIKNLMGVLSMWNIFPKGLYMDELMKVARVELAWECDYFREASYAKLFQEILEDDPFFIVPEVISDLSSKKVLTTEYVYGETLDKAFGYDQETRNLIAKNFLRLCFEELFIHQLMQTDPNWANFLYNTEKRKVYLLDFGASRKFDRKFVDSYIEIIHGGATEDRDMVLKHSQKLGFLTGYETKTLEKVHVDAVMILGEPFRSDEPFDFGNQNITKRIHNIIPVMAEQRLTAPPEQSYSLHRKIAGAFLLCANMRAKISCKEVFDDIYRRHKSR